jgi:hypothetical protein
MRPRRGRRIRRVVRWTLAPLTIVVLVTAGTDARGERPAVAAADEVVLVGDSLAQEASPYLERQLGDTPLLEQYWGGTAPCDWLGKDLQAAAGRVVVVSFTGNSLTPCMADPSGEFLRGQALVDKYRLDLQQLVEEIRATGATVVVVGQPRRGPAATAGTDADLEVAGINAIYADLAQRDGVSFVDAGAAVETPDGDYTTTLPCLPGEVQCGIFGDNAVRNDDGVHLCLGASPEPCAGYSSGAYRFAEAIADALDVR